MRRALAVFVVGTGLLLGLPVIAVVGAVGGVAPPTAEALDEIPAPYLAMYQDASLQRCPSMPWSVLAAIGGIESSHGRIRGAHLQPDGSVQPPIIGPVLDGSAGTQFIADTDGGRYDGDAEHDRAVGPMQFIPTTWAAYGIDASRDGTPDPHNAIDAVHTAAVYLCANGADDPARLRDAVWAYNHSWDYVGQVLANASRYAVGTSGTTPASATLIAMVLTNPRLDIYEAGRADIAAGRIDARVLTVLQLASERHDLRVSSLRTGHSRCVGRGNYDGCSVSHHWHGRGADISSVDGSSVSRSNPAARELANWLGSLAEPLRPDEIGTPWADLTDGPYFHDSDHLDHIHVAHGVARPD